MIGLVTVTFNSATVIPEFFESLAAQDTATTLYAVDNASPDDSLDLLAKATGIDLQVLPQSTNGGIAVGNNVGIRKALEHGCEWIVLINNDTTFDSGLIGGLLATAREAKARIVVPSIRYYDNPAVVWFEAATYAHWRGSIPVSSPPAPPLRVIEIECACTCCALVHRSVFEEVGLMDERYFVYWDDTDFFLRCHRAGVVMVLDPRLSILHKVSALTGGSESEFSQRERIKNRVYFVRKHNRLAVRWMGIALTAWNGLRLGLGSSNRRDRLRLLAKAFSDGMHMPVQSSRSRPLP
jgi:GT2 family glycosyltransferase